MAQSSSKNPSTAGPSTTGLTKNVVSAFRPAKVFKNLIEAPQTAVKGDPWLTHSPKSITSISFDETGERCVTAVGDETFMLWDARKGKKQKTFFSKKYGISLARFTHRSANIIHASTRLEDHAIRYHSMHDNTYLSYFRGHTGRVRSLHMCPTDDAFLSAGDDGTVRIWDLRAPSCRALLNDVGGTAVAAFDNSGLVFAVACFQTQTIMLYAVSSMDHSPFHYAALIDPALSEISMPPPKPIYTSIAFSNDGNYLLIGTSSDAHYLVDAFDLVILRRLVGHQGLERDKDGQKGIIPRRGASGEEVCFTGDSKWVVSGSADGAVVFWDISPEMGKEKLEVIIGERGKVAELLPTIRLEASANAGFGPSRSVRMNPRYAMMGVGGEEFSMWLPAKEEDKPPEGW
ncbi:hypothetical protein M231_07216 [Tremella mesenterica]|uniref:Uncharacterized protein n=1 Tax=Tremella mesenterica TaxID=5217 RepID=A0A4Q1BBS9_TREME|nr:uncharacterized protein TREMEDRAFT_58881 [Tremella mesenterica DSM 1558]EIW72712.1 hypothetical protein TREMEDRAFT_58881 [Tremella mesenterica DSM 1558]RXK35537.1 hypothetical protein M231_07216 [Tremella mesenterica]